MFENDVEIRGKHARYLKIIQREAHLYQTYIDVYMNAAVFGLLHDRYAPRDTGGKDKDNSARIYADAFAHHRNDCVFLYRLVMLLEQKTDADTKQRVDRAFRDDANTQEPDKLRSNMELFHEYVRGGIEEMYEEFIDGKENNPDELILNAVDVMESFKNELDDSFNYDNIIDNILK